jgi:hypothetical protein
MAVTWHWIDKKTIERPHEGGRENNRNQMSHLAGWLRPVNRQPKLASFLIAFVKAFWHRQFQRILPAADGVSIMKRLIIVAKRYEPELREAIAATSRAFVGGMASAASADIYEYVKRHLRQRQVPLEDRFGDPGQVSNDQAYFAHLS